MGLVDCIIDNDVKVDSILLPYTGTVHGRGSADQGAAKLAVGDEKDPSSPRSQPGQRSGRRAGS